MRGYRSRSAFKLIEIDKKFKIFYNKKTFLDLGAFPGGWSQVASEKIKNGKMNTDFESDVHFYDLWPF